MKRLNIGGKIADPRKRIVPRPVANNQHVAPYWMLVRWRGWAR